MIYFLDFIDYNKIQTHYRGTLKYDISLKSCYVFRRQSVDFLIGFPSALFRTTSSYTVEGAVVPCKRSTLPIQKGLLLPFCGNLSVAPQIGGLSPN